MSAPPPNNGHRRPVRLTAPAWSESQAVLIVAIVAIMVALAVMAG
jgi:hypothetical protein